MSKKENVAVFEDDEFWLQLIREKLEEEGHAVVAEAKTLQEALDALKLFREKNVGVAILGGSLGGVVDGKNPDNDSQVLLRRMEELGLSNVRTVGLSGLDVPGTTVDLGKQRASALGAVVTAL